MIFGYVLGNTTDLSDNDIIEGYQIACRVAYPNAPGMMRSFVIYR
jgi:hypothetical protein